MTSMSCFGLWFGLMLLLYWCRMYALGVVVQCCYHVGLVTPGVCVFLICLGGVLLVGLLVGG